MRVSFPRWAACICFSLFSLFIFLIVGEITIRFLNRMNANERSLMFSSRTFRLDHDGAVRYLPDEDIRTVAVYNNVIDYDIFFHTNNLGFVDDIDYEYEASPDIKYYAFVGDSFTAGFHGGKPWVPILRNDLEEDNIVIYNLGVTGAGIEHFYKLLMSVNKQLHLTHIVILAISSDITRKFWYPVADSSGIWFCFDHMTRSKCIDAPYIANIIDPDASSLDILKTAGDAAKERRNKVQGRVTHNVCDRSELLSFVSRSSRAILKNTPDPHRFSYSMEALRNIKEAFPSAEIIFIHLPQKHEVESGEYYIPDLGTEIESIGISYYPALNEWPWRKDMFHIHDSHPNQSGYDNIKSCVASYVFR